MQFCVWKLKEITSSSKNLNCVFFQNDIVNQNVIRLDEQYLGIWSLRQQCIGKRNVLLQSVSRTTINTARWLFLIYFWPIFELNIIFFEVAWSVVKIGLSQNQTDIIKFNQVMLVQIRETLCMGKCFIETRATFCQGQPKNIFFFQKWPRQNHLANFTNVMSKLKISL